MKSQFRFLLRSAAMALCVSFISGCGGTGDSPARVSELSSEDLNQATKFVAATEAESEVLVKEIEKAVAHQDVSAFNALIDEEKMVDRILAGLELKSDFRSGFMQGMREGGGLSNLSQEILSAVQNGGDYTFVRMVRNGNELRPMFRLSLPNSGGMNYHELIVSVDEGRQPRIADIYVYLSGELLSQSIRRLVLPAVASENSGIMARLTGVEAEFLKNISSVQKINELSQTQKYTEAYALFSTLPAALQKDKTVLMTKLLVAQQVGDNEYAQVIRELELNFPNDAARDFRAMDLLAMQEQHDELIKTVDRLLTVIQDPYLNILKVDSLLALNRTDEARQAVVEARAVAENRIDVYWVEMSMLLKARDHAATATLLDEIGEKFGMTFNDLTTVPEYAEFAKSPVGKDWMARHAADLPDPDNADSATPNEPEKATPQPDKP